MDAVGDVDSNYSNIRLSSTAWTSSAHSECAPQVFEIALCIGYCLVFVVGVSGNALILLIFRQSWKGSIMELLILYLAFFDILSSIFGPFVFLYWIVTCRKTWHFGEIGCKILPALSRIFTNISIGIILIMAIDRCRAIFTPFKGHFKRRTIHWAVGVTVGLSILCEGYYINALLMKDGTCTLIDVFEDEFAYPLVILTILRNVFFVGIFSITTILIYKVLQNAADITDSKTREKRKKVTEMVIIMVVVFGLSVMPRDILHLTFTISWMSSKNGIRAAVVPANQVLKLLQVSNSIYNVFIYGKKHAHFWQNLKVTLSCREQQRLRTTTTAIVTVVTSQTRRRSSCPRYKRMLLQSIRENLEKHAEMTGNN